MYGFKVKTITELNLANAASMRAAKQSSRSNIGSEKMAASKTKLTPPE